MQPITIVWTETGRLLVTANGHIVILKTGKYEYAALFMSSSKVEHVPLPKFTVEVTKVCVQ